MISEGFVISNEDLNRPWGGFFVIDNSEIQTTKFLERFNFTKSMKSKMQISPKILVVKPRCRLSWQYHLRRAEIWRVIKGPVGVIQSSNNIERELMILESNALIEHPREFRHRLIGLENWGLVAEIWCHSDSEHPSDESDIVRVQDDYSRQNRSQQESEF